MAYSTVDKGYPNTESYRVFFKNSDGVPISPFHDIPLLADAQNNVFNMVVEIPRWTNAKMEINKEEKLNPIKQDVKNGKLRFVKNVFPYHGYLWNYGALPQTFEDPSHVTPETGTRGDSDPIDVCEIGHKVHPRGAIIQVKILGVMCLIDEGETDWKIIAVDVTDPLAPKLNDVSDVETHCPGLIKATYNWFTYYKVPDGKPVNQFAFNGEAKGKDYALQVIQDSHQQWRHLINSAGNSPISRFNTTVNNSPQNIDKFEALQIIDRAAVQEISQEVNFWYYIKHDQ